MLKWQRYGRTLLLAALLAVSACRGSSWVDPNSVQDDIRYDCSTLENMKLKQCRR